MMPTSPSFSDWLENKKTGFHHRQFLLLSLPLDESIGFLYKIVDSFENTALISNEFCIPNILHIPIARYQDYLGQQTGSLIFDARSGIHLNALYASVGMVSVTGIIVILLPSGKKNILDTNENAQGIKFTYGFSPPESYFITLFITQAHKHNAAAITPIISHLPNSLVRNPLEGKNKRQDTLITLSEQQVAIKANITQRVSQHLSANTISVILGPRGRGKSTLLAHIGLDLLRRLRHLGVNVVVSALHKKQLQAFYMSEHLHVSQSKLELNEQGHDNSTLIAFYSLDEVIAKAPKNAIVLIDEIGSVAPQLLQKILNHFSHCIISGTATGYEGSGKGFIHRVLPSLQTHEHTQLYSLYTPFRWLTDDAVETCLDSIMGESQNKMPLNTPHSKVLDELVCCVVEKRTLIENETLYAQIISLLVQAHYQTTPNDIVRMLDAPDCKIVVAKHYKPKNDKAREARETRETIVGAVVMFNEGSQLLAPIAPDISIGKRRVQGHLTPQSLSFALLSENVSTLRYLRINRIAVKDIYKRHGVGSKLLHYCQHIGKISNTHYLSVSYGYTQSLDSFWQQNGFTLAKLGHRIDSASGTSSVIMLKTINSADCLPANLLRFNALIDYHYMCRTHPRLASLYEHLFTSKLENSQTYDTLIKAHVNKVVTMFVNRKINIEKASPILLWCLMNNRFTFDTQQTDKLIHKLQALTHKGIHKQVKNESRQKIYDAIKQHSISL